MNNPIIVLILYLILQCRSQRRKRRAARAAGLHCDSNSGSYMERSTVDFIVPGEWFLNQIYQNFPWQSRAIVILIQLTVDFIVPGETPDLSKLFLSLKDPLNSTTVESVAKFDFCNNIFIVIQGPIWNNRLWNSLSVIFYTRFISFELPTRLPWKVSLDFILLMLNDAQGHWNGLQTVLYFYYRVTVLKMVFFNW